MKLPVIAAFAVCLLVPLAQAAENGEATARAAVQKLVKERNIKFE